jgi:hypothetical protein
MLTFGIADKKKRMNLVPFLSEKMDEKQPKKIEQNQIPKAKSNMNVLQSVSFFIRLKQKVATLRSVTA